MKENIKTICIIILAITCTIIMFMYSNLKTEYSINEHSYQMTADSLCSEVSLASNRYDSLHSHTDSIYKLQKASYDSLNELYKIKIDTHKEQITVIYKDSTVIHYVEDTHEEQEHQIEYVEKEVIKEVVQTVHDTIAVTKVDTIYQDSKVEITKTNTETNKDVVKNEEFFNIYIDGGIKGTLDFDIIPEASAGVIIKEKFYGEIGVNYDNKKINPNAKLGIRLKLI